MPRFSITFDDGNISQFLDYVPILYKYSIHATFYVVATEVGLPGKMSAEDLRQLLQEGNEIGSHGLRHKSLTTLSEWDMKSEIQLSLQMLHSYNVKSFSYPNGLNNGRIINEVSKCYDSARSYVYRPFGSYLVLGNNTDSLRRHALYSIPAEGRFSEFINPRSSEYLLARKDVVSSNKWFILTLHGATSVKSKAIGSVLRNLSREKMVGYAEDIRTRLFHSSKNTLKYFDEFCRDLSKNDFTVDTVSNTIESCSIS
ncbi:MAG: polysaccharide deacetylase family protein [Thaumarchaeota archaeon]|nr:polysaccharide deacetylase family protein [Nitrososphaerota archaeon]